MIRYAISDRRQFSGDETSRLRGVVGQALLLAEEGVDYFQIREKDLPEDVLVSLAREIGTRVQQAGVPMRVLLNAPREVAERAGVGWHASGAASAPDGAVSVSCHTLAQVEATRDRAQVLLFAPVFAKTVNGVVVQRGSGVPLLREAVQCARSTPVLALGGVTEANAAQCVEAGAAGIAAIRMFYRRSHQHG